MRNKNARGKRVKRDRVAVNMSVSAKNGLLELFEEYLLSQGIHPTDEAVKELASRWAYDHWYQRLKRELELADAAIIL